MKGIITYNVTRTETDTNDKGTRTLRVLGIPLFHAECEYHNLTTQSNEGKQIGFGCGASIPPPEPEEEYEYLDKKEDAVKFLHKAGIMDKKKHKLSKHYE